MSYFPSVRPNPRLNQIILFLDHSGRSSASCRDLANKLQYLALPGTLIPDREVHRASAHVLRQLLFPLFLLLATIMPHLVPSPSRHGSKPNTES